MDKFTDGRRELLAPREFIACTLQCAAGMRPAHVYSVRWPLASPAILPLCLTAKYDPDMNLKKYDSRLNGQTASALKGKKDKSYTTFPFDKIKGKGKK
jgi:hypothetical protein